MKTAADVEQLEKLIGQLQNLQAEISQLAKKSPNDGLNKFKLTIVNKVIASANQILTGRYVPLDDFSQFEDDELPTNSDVTMVLAQYLEQIERFRSDNVERNVRSEWRYVLDGKISDIRAMPSTMVGAPKK